MQVSRYKRAPWKLASLVMVLGLILTACGADEPEEAPAEPAEEPELPEALEEGDVAEADPADDVDESAFYFDKEVEIIVPFSTGGGTDAQARFMAPFLPNYIPGAPSVGVFNIAGAGGTIGNNQFWNQRDHEEATSVLFSSASSFFPWIFSEPALDLNYLDLVGTMAIQTGGLVYVSSDTGIEGPEDFADAVREGTVDWVAGEQTPDSLGLLFILAYDMLDMDPDIIMGYEGRGPARVSFEQGELNINWDTTASVPGNVQPLIDEGSAVPVFSPGQVQDGEIVRDPVFDDVPHFAEMYEMVHGEAPSGELYDAYISLLLSGFTLQKVMWLHQDAPADAVEGLMTGFEAMTQDPGFQEQALDIIGDYDLIVGDDVQGAVDTLLDFPDERRDLLINYMVENFDYVDPRE